MNNKIQLNCKQFHLKDDDTKIGSIINSETHADGSNYALAVIELDKLNELLFSNNRPIIIQELPYAIES